MKTIYLLAFLFLLCVTLASCLTPAEMQTSYAVLDQLLAQKVITAEQYQQLMEVLTTGGTTWLRDLGVLVGGSLGGALVTRLQRGIPQKVRAQQRAAAAPVPAD